MDRARDYPSLPRLVAWIVSIAAVDGVFVLAASKVPAARRGIFTNVPPFYAHYAPAVSPWILAAVAVAAAVAAIAGALERMPAVAVPVAGTVCLLAFAGSVALARGRPSEIVDPIRRSQTLVDYAADAPVLERMGVRSFVSEYPSLVRSNAAGSPMRAGDGRLHSIHSVSHPPGNVVLAWLLQRAAPRPYARAAIIAAIASLVAVPTWWLARLAAGRRVASISVALLAVMPGPAMYVFTSMDAVDAVFLTAVAAASTWAVTRGKVASGVIAGVIAGISFFFAFQTAFIVAFAVVLAFAVRPKRQALRVLAAAAAGGVATLAALRLGLGFDLVADFRASGEAIPALTTRSYPFWLAGNWVAWLTFAGLPVAALLLRRLPRAARSLAAPAAISRSTLMLAFFAPVALFYALPPAISHVIPGETERVWQFAYPFAAVGAATWLARYGERGGSPATLRLIVAMTALQAIVMQVLLRTYW